MTARERRRAIIELLCVRRHEKRDNLAREFGVSKRTIEYDILQLSLEYPIYTTTGRYGGVSVVEGFCLSEEKLSCRQQALLERLKQQVSASEAELLDGIIKKFGIYGQKEEC